MVSRSVILIVFCCSMTATHGQADDFQQAVAADSGKAWEITILRSGDEDVTDNFPECERDDLWIFYSDGRYILNDNTESCEGGADSTGVLSTGTWQYSRVKRRLIITEAEKGTRMIFEVEKFDAERLVLHLTRGDITSTLVLTSEPNG